MTEPGHTGSLALRARWAGFVGVVLAVVGSYGAGALPVTDPTAHWPILGLLRHGAGPRIALALVYAGVATLGLAWLYLGRAVRRRDPGTTPGALRATCAWWGGPLLLSVPLFSRDVWSYAAQANLTHAGLDPYRVGPDVLSGPYLDQVQRIWVDTPAPYGPLWLMLGRGVAAVTGDHVILTAEVMRLLSVLGVLLLVRYLPRLAASCGGDPRVALWLGVANPLLLLHFVSGGHNDALMLGLAVAGLALVAEGHGVAGVAISTLGVAVKAPIGLVVAFCVPLWAARLDGAHRWWRALGGVVVVSVTVFTIVTLLSGLGVGWLDGLTTPGALITWVSVSSGLGLLADLIGRLFGAGDHRASVVATFRTAGQVVAGVVSLGLWAFAQRIGVLRALALALLAVVLLGPIVQPWYLVWPFAVAAALSLPAGVTALIAGVSVAMSMLITPQGATLYDRPAALIATTVAAVIATVVVLGSASGPSTSDAAGRAAGIVPRPVSRS
jgi:alpha-1,6-mannosyltransferase